MGHWNSLFPTQMHHGPKLYFVCVCFYLSIMCLFDCYWPASSVSQNFNPIGQVWVWWCFNNISPLFSWLSLPTSCLPLCQQYWGEREVQSRVLLGYSLMTSAFKASCFWARNLSVVLKEHTLSCSLRLLVKGTMRKVGVQNYCCCSVAKLCLTLQPHGLQHSRLPCLSPSPRVCSNSCPLSQWYHPTIHPVSPFFSRPQSFLASESFPMHQSPLKFSRMYSSAYGS